MTDVFSPEKRSDVMSRIKGKNTSIEMKVRKWLSSHGYRYRLHVRKLPGSPDLVMSKYRTVIFVNGCFWHGHEDCKESRLPKSKTDWWKNKIGGNVERDIKNIEKLKQMGWYVHILWECEIEHNFDIIMDKLNTELQQRLL